MTSYPADLWAVVPDNRVKFGDPRLNRPLEIPPEAVLGGIFDGFSLKPRTGISEVISCGVLAMQNRKVSGHPSFQQPTYRK